MSKYWLGTALAFALLAGLSSGEVGEPKETFEWSVAAPAEVGFSPVRLTALAESLAKKKTKSLLVIRQDRIALEWYAAGRDAKTKHYAASLSKPIVGALALALLMGDGKLKLDDLASMFIPQWADDPRKSKITIRHLASHTSGIQDAHIDGVPHEKLPGWMGEFWKRLEPPNDPFTISRDTAPVLFEPGAKMHYSNPGIAMLGYMVTASLKDSPQKDLRTLLRERVMRKIGIADQDWSVGYGKTFNVNGLPLVAPWGGGSFTPRAVARIGRLMLREGDWDGKRILTKEAVQLTTRDAGTPGHCGMAWWSNNEGRYPKLPRDAFWGSGAGHQVLFVVPSLKLIAVRNGENLPPPADHHDALYEHLFGPLIEAIDDAKKGAPCPPSPAIKALEWAPKEAIVRKAKGSDNWPMTWADDDHLYTAYGDGWGFEPKAPRKLGLGFARVEGPAKNFSGINIPSPTGEQIGDGARAKKASGMLMVDGILYMWTRNAGNSQLAWSKDRGQTWSWSDWKFTTSFGCPTFLNFGKNYTGARDDFVYVYSHDHDSAYEAADRMVLARVPKERIMERSAYEFFRGVDAKKKALWTKDITERGGVFSYPGRCFRSAVTYNPGLKRYLWVQIIPDIAGKKVDTRFEGGFAIYDAPEPWGPWTTVFFTERWDVAPGETASLPTKWMSADGRTMHLVFSGEDCFSVRKGTVR